MNNQNLLSADTHQQMQLLLPWYQNKTLDQVENQLVEKHLRTCIMCRSQMNSLNKLAKTVKQSSILEVAAETSFASLEARLRAVRPDLKTSAPTLVQVNVNTKNSGGGKPNLLGKTSSRGRRFLGFNTDTLKNFAIAASLVLVSTPIMMHNEQHLFDIADYFTLSATKPEIEEGVKLSVVFKESLSTVDIDNVLENIHGQIIEGPNKVGAYIVRLGADKNSLDLNETITLLRSQQNVVLAEPVLEH